MFDRIIEATTLVLTILLIGRVVISFLNLDPRNPISDFLVSVTEPILAPIRSIMPRTPVFDFTPMIAIILIQVIGSIIASNV